MNRYVLLLITLFLPFSLSANEANQQEEKIYILSTEEARLIDTHRLLHSPIIIPAGPACQPPPSFCPEYQLIYDRRENAWFCLSPIPERYDCL